MSMPAGSTTPQLHRVFKPDGDPISDDDSETVFPDRNPSIDLAKTLLSNADEDGSGDVSLGDTVTYQFVATNDGDTGLDNVIGHRPAAGAFSIDLCARRWAPRSPRESR